MSGEWPGGPCSQCGEEMPPRLVHCRSCRALLNSELTEDSIEIPSFFALPEISVTASASPRGHYVSCPGCLQELRIHSKYKGLRVQCKHCSFAQGWPQRPAAWQGCAPSGRAGRGRPRTPAHRAPTVAPPPGANHPPHCEHDPASERSRSGHRQPAPLSRRRAHDRACGPRTRLLKRPQHAAIGVQPCALLLHFGAMQRACAPHLGVPNDLL